MKVSDIITRVKRIEVLTDKLDNVNKHDSINDIDLSDIIDLLDEYKDELLNKVVK